MAGGIRECIDGDGECMGVCKENVRGYSKAEEKHLRDHPEDDPVVYASDPDATLGNSSAPDLTCADPQVADNFGEGSEDIREYDVCKEWCVVRRWDQYPSERSASAEP